MASQYALGVDIGATKTAFVVVDGCGNVYHQDSFPTQPHLSHEAIIARIADKINAIHAEYDLIGVGVGSAGYVDSERGVVRLAVNLGWQDVPVRRLLTAHLNKPTPISLLNDVDALMLGEVVFGGTRGARDLVYLAIGTGLGAAALTDGKRIAGARYAGMELGHMPLPNNRRRCACGKQGCLETSLSGLGLLATHREYAQQYPSSVLAHSSEVTTHDIIAAMQTRDALAQIIRQEVITSLVYTLLICQSMLDPDQYVIGGGMGRALAPLVLDSVRQKFRQDLGVDVAPRIQVASLEQSAIGATVPIWQGEVTLP